MTRVDEELVLDLVVYGAAEPAGSKTRTAYGVRDSNPKSRPWKHQVAQIVAVHLGNDPLELGPLELGPLTLRLDFYTPRPKGHHKPDGTLNTPGRRLPYPTRKPDVLKLARAVEDALTGIAYRDDAQIVREHLAKHYGAPARVRIRIYRITSTSDEDGDQ